MAMDDRETFERLRYEQAMQQSAAYAQAQMAASQAQQVLGSVGSSRSGYNAATLWPPGFGGTIPSVPLPDVLGIQEIPECALVLVGEKTCYQTKAGKLFSTDGTETIKVHHGEVTEIGKVADIFAAFAKKRRELEKK